MPETTQFSGFDDDQFGSTLAPDTILLARYRIQRYLARGGYGAVYQARDLNFPDAKRLVAVKEMLVTTSDPKLRTEAIKQFRREANILATLSHPAIPKIYDFFDQNDRAYLVMEYINGNNLEEILIKTKKIPIDKILEWGIELCDVLDYLHNQPEPIIFRDMKPQNVMVDAHGRVRLIDFGIAKVFEMGKKHTMIGTEGYSAPEQYKGDANPLSDIYSLGATIHQVITRKDPRLEPPFSFAERPITEYNPEATAELAAVIDRSLAFDPKDRFQSCAEMKRALEQVRFSAMQPLVNSNSSGASPQPRKEATAMLSEDQLGGIQPKWKFTVEDEIRGGVSSYGSLVFVGSYDTNVWAIKLEDGTQAWKYATEGGVVSSPLIDRDQKQILFGSEDHSFKALDYREGRLNWSYPTGGKVRSTGCIAHGRVFFGSDDGKLYALVAANGNYLWEHDTLAPVRSTPFVTNERIIFGSESGEVIGLDLSGERKWTLRTRRGGITSSPVVDQDGICYVGAFDGNVYALEANGGFSQWRHRTGGPIISSPAIQDGLLYIGSTDGKLYCINIQSTKEKWSFETEKPIVGSPVVHEGTVYFGGTDSYFYAVDARDGKLQWKFQTQGAITSKPCITEDLIIFGSLDHTLYALPLVTT